MTENKTVSVEQKSDVLLTLIKNIQCLTSFTNFSGVSEDGQGNFTFELGISQPNGGKEILIVRLAFSLAESIVQINVLTKKDSLQLNHTNLGYKADLGIFEFAGVFAQHLNKLLLESRIKTSQGEMSLYPLVRESAEMFYGRLFLDLREL